MQLWRIDLPVGLVVASIFLDLFPLPVKAPAVCTRPGTRGVNGLGVAAQWTYNLLHEFIRRDHFDHIIDEVNHRLHFEMVEYSIAGSKIAFSIIRSLR